MKKQLALQTKINLSVVLLILSFGIIVTLFVFYQSLNLLTFYAKENLNAIITEQSQILNVVFSNSEMLVKSMANNEQVIHYMSDPSSENNDVLLSEIQKYNINDAFSAIYLIDISGETLISTDPTFIGENYAFRGYFQNALEETSWVEANIGVTSKISVYDSPLIAF
jgi:C4-dicarboxylate-specific signal transduction histidine kinase